MHQKSLNIFIQRRFTNFFLINDFGSAGGWKSFFSGVSSPDELFLSKLDISITKGKEKHA